MGKEVATKDAAIVEFPALVEDPKALVAALRENMAGINFPALVEDPKALVAALRENMAGAGFSAFDLDRIKIPSGGNLSWTVPGLEGDIRTEQVIGIIMGIQNCRAYWSVTFADSGGGSPPDCSSEDAITGYGDPGGLCASCPYSQFKSDSRQLGQACKQIKRIFLLMPDSNLPRVVPLPPTSLKGSTQYMLRLSSQGLKFYQVVTRLTLAPDKNKTGIEYSKAVFAMVGKLTAEQAQAAEAMGKALAPFMRGAPTAEEVGGGPDEKVF